MSVLWVALGGAFGACARYLLDGLVMGPVSRAAAHRGRPAFPWGTLTVNVLASFLIGLVAGAFTPLGVAVATAASSGVPATTSPVPAGGTGIESAWLFLAVGGCGALSTYSTFSNDTVSLLRAGSTGRAMKNVLVNVVATVGAVVAGVALALALGAPKGI